jgi:hypothetical protein
MIEIKEQVLNGLLKRKRDLLQTLHLTMNQENDFQYIIQDANIRLDEIESLIEWVKKLE